MFNIYTWFFKFIGAVFLLKMTALAVIFLFGLNILLMGDSDIQEIEKQTITRIVPSQIYIKLRLNLLKFYGKIIPLKKSYFPKLSREENYFFPNPKNALLKFSKFQQEEMGRFVIGCRMLPRYVEFGFQEFSK